MKFDSNLPIYLQIMEEIKRLIVIGSYVPAQKIPSVRDLAIDFGVNPNTVQRALSELEREGLLNSERTSGRYISDDEQLIQQLKQKMIIQKTDQYLVEVKHYGCDDTTIIESIKERLADGKFN